MTNSEEPPDSDNLSDNVDHFNPEDAREDEEDSLVLKGGDGEEDEDLDGDPELSFGGASGFEPFINPESSLGGKLEKEDRGLSLEETRFHSQHATTLALAGRESLVREKDALDEEREVEGEFIPPDEFIEKASKRCRLDISDFREAIGDVEDNADADEDEDDENDEDDEDDFVLMSPVEMRLAFDSHPLLRG